MSQDVTHKPASSGKGDGARIHSERGAASQRGRKPRLCATSPDENARRSEVPAFVAALQAPSEPQVSPALDPDHWYMAFIDVETTGLIPGYHEMVDIGIVMSDVQGNEVGRFFLRVMPEHPERASAEIEGINNFTVQRWQELGAVSIPQAVAQIIAFHRATAGDRGVLMVAHNSHFDLSFLDHLFRAAGRGWRELYYYHVLDLPSMAWGLGIRHLYQSDLCKYFGIPDEPYTPQEHTGISGADTSFRLYRALLKHKSS